MILIEVILSLIALSLGMFLLAATRKENHGSMFNLISWFIIIMAILTLICSGVRTVMHLTGHYPMHREMMYMHRDMDEMHDGAMMHEEMMEHRGMKMRCCGMKDDKECGGDEHGRMGKDSTK